MDKHFSAAERLAYLDPSDPSVDAPFVINLCLSLRAEADKLTNHDVSRLFDCLVAAMPTTEAVDHHLSYIPLPVWPKSLFDMFRTSSAMTERLVAISSTQTERLVKESLLNPGPINNAFRSVIDSPFLMASIEELESVEAGVDLRPAWSMALKHCAMSEDVVHRLSADCDDAFVLFQLSHNPQVTIPAEIINQLICNEQNNHRTRLAAVSNIELCNLSDDLLIWLVEQIDEGHGRSDVVFSTQEQIIQCLVHGNLGSLPDFNTNAPGLFMSCLSDKAYAALDCISLPEVSNYATPSTAPPTIEHSVHPHGPRR